MSRADYDLGFLLRYENIAWYENGKVSILDRRIYPMKIEFVVCNTYMEVAKAIKDMVTQSGGPFMAAGMGMALAAYEARSLKEPELVAFLKKAAYDLSHARPTTSAAMVAITERALKIALEALSEGANSNDLAEIIRQDVVKKTDEKFIRYDKIGKFLADKIPNKGTIMTQCFGETVVGTLLRECKARGNEIKVICPETRPYFQGARLTASLAKDMGFDVTVITDNMPAYTIRAKKVDLFTSAADVITMDGHVVNKVGTFQIALAADYFGVPYYVTGEPDRHHENMSSVVIEERDGSFATEALGRKTVMDGVKGYYPAFDVTPPELVKGVVTDKGILSPYELKKYFE